VPASKTHFPQRSNLGVLMIIPDDTSIEKYVHDCAVPLKRDSIENVSESEIFQIDTLYPYK
jgi:hypothetical protein